MSETVPGGSRRPVRRRARVTGRARYNGSPPPPRRAPVAELAPPPPGPAGGASVARKVAGSVVNLVGAFGAVTVLSVITTVGTTRLLGPSGYGIYGSVVALSAILGAISDFGFSLMLIRDGAVSPEQLRPMVRTAYRAAGAWSLVLSLVMVGIAFTAPIGSDRGIALLVLAPSVAFNGLNPATAVFMVLYRTRTLMKWQVGCTALQLVGSIGLAAAGFGPVAVTAVVSVTSIFQNIGLWLAAERLMPRTPGHYPYRSLLRRALPLGLLSIMTRIYLMIDLVLLGWYVVGPRLGDYAASSKLLTVLAGLAGSVMYGALPALATSRGVRSDLNELLARVWQWLLVGAVPIFLGLALFAPILIDIALGPRYHGAVTLTRILCIAGVVTVVSNLVGNTLVAMQRTRQLFIQNGIAISVNIAGNLLLIPHYGVYAAAWMTAVTEVLVCTISLASLRHDIDFAVVLRPSVRPAVALVGSAAIALLLIDHQWLALAVSAPCYALLLTVLHGWPAEVISAVRRRPGRPRTG